MDERIESFLADVLALESENANAIRRACKSLSLIVLSAGSE
jgi:hypothetical protein